MASITAHPVIRPRRSAPAATEIPVEDDHQPVNAVAGPDERTLARTAAAVVTSIVLMISTIALVAAGAGAIIRGLAGWFLG